MNKGIIRQGSVRSVEEWNIILPFSAKLFFDALETIESLSSFSRAAQPVQLLDIIQFHEIRQTIFN